LTPKHKTEFVLKDRSIKNLIFDLGGVILDLSVETTLQSFATLSGLDESAVTKQFVTSAGFEQYEKGEIDDDAFRAFVRELFRVDAPDDKLDACWNAMLLGIPVAKLKLLETLKDSYRVYLLSNTNNIHVHYINNTLLTRMQCESLDDYFHKAYYSHKMKKRKPDLDIFQQVIDENHLTPDHTLFLDDNFANVEGAGKLGIKTLHVKNPDMIYDYFS
jgi:putative hydrolase of the HAD superfamily